MGTEPIKFHRVHGQNIRLSNNETEATRTESFNQALCFTNRPVGKDEKLVVKIVDTSSTWSGTLRVGVTEHDPNTLASSLPKYLCPDLNMQPGNWGKALEEHHVRLNQEIIIFHQNGRVMIRDGERAPEEFLTVHSVTLPLFRPLFQSIRPLFQSIRPLFPFNRRFLHSFGHSAGVPSGKPLYVLFDIYGNTKSIRISMVGQRPPSPIPSPVAAPVPPVPKIKSKYFGNALFSPARLHDFASEGIKVSSQSASTDRPLATRCSFAVTKSLLSKKQTLVIRLEKLHNLEPIRFILTTESPTAVYRYGNMEKLCDETYSIPVRSETPVTGEELAISIAANGFTYISHNNRPWQERVNVDPNLQYNVVIDMEHIGKMSVVGITSSLEPISYAPPPATTPAPPKKPEATREASGAALPDCIICFETPRAVLLEPCNHFALCETCWRKLQKTPNPLCPSCRGVIKGMRKIYMS